MNNYVVRVLPGTPNEVRVIECLEKMNIEYSVIDLKIAHYIRFKVTRKIWNKIKRDLDLVIDSFYCSPRI